MLQKLRLKVVDETRSECIGEAIVDLPHLLSKGCTYSFPHRCVNDRSERNLRFPQQFIRFALSHFQPISAVLTGSLGTELALTHPGDARLERRIRKAGSFLVLHGSEKSANFKTANWATSTGASHRPSTGSGPKGVVLSIQALHPPALFAGHAQQVGASRTLLLTASTPTLNEHQIDANTATMKATDIVFCDRS
jgi:hypothetical protein